MPTRTANRSAHGPGANPEKTVHTPGSFEDIVHSFEEADHHEVSLKGYRIEDWLCQILFWIMAALVVLQFFTRYVLNDSYAWTEELGIYCLIGVVFTGSAMCVRVCRHIQVDFVYRYLPKTVGRVLATLVDVLRSAFFLYAIWLTWRYIALIGYEPMAMLFWNKAYVYWMVLVGFVMMALRSLQVSVQNWRQGYSILENPSAYD